MADDSILVDRDGAVATVAINRPEVYNALNAEVLERLASVVRELGDEGARAIVITGTGEKAFSAGADLNELAGLGAAEAHAVLAAGQRTMAAIEASRVPVIAAVNGLALGGGFELVLSATFAVLAEHAQLGLPETGLGLIPGYGGTQRLPALVGRAVAAHVMLTGERLTAARSHELGLTPVPPVPAAELSATVKGIARTIAAKGPRAQSAVLTALRTSTAAEAGLALESALAGIATGSAEAAEGIAAFRGKRAPEFPTANGK